MIHCIWYCVSAPSNRFEQAEVDFLKSFIGEASEYNVSVIIVLTQSYNTKGAESLKKEIEKEHLPIVNIVPVLAENYAIDDDYVKKAYGLDMASLCEILVYVGLIRFNRVFYIFLSL